MDESTEFGGVELWRNGLGSHDGRVWRLDRQRGYRDADSFVFLLAGVDASVD